MTEHTRCPWGGAFGNPQIQGAQRFIDLTSQIESTKSVQKVRSLLSQFSEPDRTLLRSTFLNQLSEAFDSSQIGSSRYFSSPLEYALSKNHKNVIRFLHTLDIEYAHLLRALNRFTVEGRLKPLIELLQRWEFAQDNLDDALHVACTHGRVSIAQLLLEYGANIHASNESALRIACTEGHFDLVRFLLDSGATPTEECVRVATERGHTAVRSLLIARGGIPVAVSVGSVLDSILRDV